MLQDEPLKAPRNKIGATLLFFSQSKVCFVLHYHRHLGENINRYSGELGNQNALRVPEKRELIEK